MESPNIELKRVNPLLGENVAAARGRRGWTQAELAEAMARILEKPVNTSTINRLEKGTRPTPLTELFALSEALRISVYDLLPPQDDLMAVSRPLFRAVQDTDDDIQRYERQLGDLRDRRRELGRALSAYWVLRSALVDKERTDSVERIEQSATLLYDTLYSLGERFHAGDLAEALRLSDDRRERIEKALNDGAMTPYDLREFFLNEVVDHFEELRNAPA